MMGVGRMTVLLVGADQLGNLPKGAVVCPLFLPGGVSLTLNRQWHEENLNGIFSRP